MGKRLGIDFFSILVDLRGQVGTKLGSKIDKIRSKKALKKNAKKKATKSAKIGILRRSRPELEGGSGRGSPPGELPPLPTALARLLHSFASLRVAALLKEDTKRHVYDMYDVTTTTKLDAQTPLGRRIYTVWVVTINSLLRIAFS